MARLALKEILAEREISHRKFAEMVKMDRNVLLKYLREGANPTMQTLARFAKALNVSICKLIKE
jgi:transcriptional regulator with XRE-family HTH domain